MEIKINIAMETEGNFGINFVKSLITINVY